MAAKKKVYDPIKMVKYASRQTIGEIPKPKVVLSKKKKEPRFKEMLELVE